jgi:hypothetical protein
VAATPRFEVRQAAEALEVAQRVITHEHDIAPATPVATIRPALGDVGFATEAQASVATATGLDVNACVILHGQDADTSGSASLITGAPYLDVNQILVRPTAQPS